MKHTETFLSLLILLVLCVASQTASAQKGIQVEIKTVKILGVSATDETKSIIEVRWETIPLQDPKIKSFDIKLEVIYANGQSVTKQFSVGGTARNGRTEIATVHTSSGRPPAMIKAIKTSISTSETETVTKQFPM